MGFYFRNDSHKYRNDCKQCRSSDHKEYYQHTCDKNKKYKRDNREKRNNCEKKRRQTDFNFKLICNIRNRTHQAFRAQNRREFN